METTIGGKRYPAFGIGKLSGISKEESKFRVTGYYEQVALITLDAIAEVTALCPVASSQKDFTIKSISALCWFLDSGAGHYDISERVQIAPNFLSNADPQPNIFLSARYIPNNYNLVMNTGNNDFLTFQLRIFGGDVRQLTTITPGAGDLVRFFLQVVYQ